MEQWSTQHPELLMLTMIQDLTNYQHINNIIYMVS